MGYAVLVLAVAIALHVQPPQALHAAFQDNASTARIQLSNPRGDAHRAITLEDIIALREVHDTRLSPDGRAVAYLVRQAFLECNCYRTAIYVARAVGQGIPIKVLEETSISNLRWSPDGRWLTYLSPRSGSRQMWRLPRNGGQAEQVFSHAPGAGQDFYELLYNPVDSGRVAIEQYEWSADGWQIAYTTTPATDSAEARHAINDGIIYDDDKMWLFDLLQRKWTREPFELWVYDLRSKSARRVWRAPMVGWMPEPVGLWGFSWSPDGRRIAVSYPARISALNSWPSYDLAIVDVATSNFTILITTDSIFEKNPVWSPNGQRIAFAADFDHSLNSLGSRSSLGIIDVTSREVKYYARGLTGTDVANLWWLPGDEALAFEAPRAGGELRMPSGLYRVDLKTDKVRRLTGPLEHISGCSPLVNMTSACVLQNANVPPDPSVVDITTGQTRTVAATNPELRNITLSPVVEMRWKNDFRRETNGYLLRPHDYVPGRRYPLLVILYGFEGKFVTDAEWMTNYPAQVFAREGFAVLLWNYPHFTDWVGKDNSKGTVSIGYSPLSSLETAVSVLADRGLIDPNLVGIMGVSYGGFWSEFAITNSPLFQVASVANNGSFNPGAYWAFGSRYFREAYEKVLGGPPYGPTLVNWLAFSPALNAHRVMVPVLMEASANESIVALEMFTALRRHDVPVEFAIYPDEGHVMIQPVHRLASMRRNLEWFSFWLLGREGPHLDRWDQYLRWRAMRSQLAGLRSGLQPNRSR